jgi:hypothetical protein
MPKTHLTTPQTVTRPPHGIRHVIRDKVHIFTGETLDAKSVYPSAGSMQREVAQRFEDGVGRRLARVSTERFGVESVDGVTEFMADANLVTTFLR